MRLENGLESWLFPVEPMEGESLSHFLGRVRRRNHLTPNALGQLAGIGAIITRWERFHLNPFPTDKELKALGEVVGVDAERLREMLPPKGEGMMFEPIRLCGACYADSACHKIEWQFKSVWMCEKHRLKLLSKCPQCGKKFKIPALWEFGECDRCRLLFREMAKSSKIQQTSISLFSDSLS
ncbi:conserved hypothetical protein [Gloeothece citriformis PCC 7424]|uniref:TniQ domain-containing protein n=1 Tax=Gloeothece citriformis (strain PCC 7424) TaxID=65393 RepID=B7KIM4_GLOC7|nr:TniQ family protein [Gloeothece citriformis]ACK69430.1 conserved hypothetical protein [Gloeothece citriformis PCC 7424]